ncbi:MAG: hypothetical protein MHMPM18_001123 [Marteilia pararefringens]
MVVVSSSPSSTKSSSSTSSPSPIDCARLAELEEQYGEELQNLEAIEMQIFKLETNLMRESDIFGTKGLELSANDKRRIFSNSSTTFKAHSGKK